MLVGQLLCARCKKVLSYPLGSISCCCRSCLQYNAAQNILVQCPCCKKRLLAPINTLTLLCPCCASVIEIPEAMLPPIESEPCVNDDTEKAPNTIYVSYAAVQRSPSQQSDLAECEAVSDVDKLTHISDLTNAEHAANETSQHGKEAQDALHSEERQQEQQQQQLMPLPPHPSARQAADYVAAEMQNAHFPPRALAPSSSLVSSKAMSVTLSTTSTVPPDRLVVDGDVAGANLTREEIEGCQPPEPSVLSACEIHGHHTPSVFHDASHTHGTAEVTPHVTVIEAVAEGVSKSTVRKTATYSGKTVLIATRIL